MSKNKHQVEAPPAPASDEYKEVIIPPTGGTAVTKPVKLADNEDKLILVYQRIDDIHRRIDGVDQKLDSLAISVATKVMALETDIVKLNARIDSLGTNQNSLAVVQMGHTLEIKQLKEVAHPPVQLNLDERDAQVQQLNQQTGQQMADLQRQIDELKSHHMPIGVFS